MLKFTHTIPFAGPLQQILKPALHAGFSLKKLPTFIYAHNVTPLLVMHQQEKDWSSDWSFFFCPKLKGHSLS